MATLSTNQIGASADYLRYCYDAVKKTDRVNEPTLLDLKLVPTDANFVKLVRGTYITVTTATYSIWYTGFITNDPELEFLGTQVVAGVRQPVYGYVYQVTSDEYLLNLKPLGIVPPFVNTTQGDVITYLINMLTPAGWNFNTAGIQAGQGISRYVVDPAKRFSQVVKEFSDPAFYQFSVRNLVASFVPQSTSATGIAVDGSTRDFTPSRLTLKPVNDPIVNDAIVIGDISPQSYFNEYFVGDGVTAAFQLVNGVYGVDSTVLLDDDFSDTTIDNTKWTIVDAVNSFLQPSNGFLNVLGGNNTNSFDVYLQSLTLIPIEGNMRMTHGEYDFVTASDGVIASLWSQDCDLGLNNCIYGLRATKSGVQTILNPIVNGVIDTTQSLTIDYTKRYNMRTEYACDQAIRLSPARPFRTKLGSVGVLGNTGTPSNTYASTVITAIDPNTGIITGQWTFGNQGISLPATTTYGYYCPVVSNDLNVTVTGVTISYPCQAQLSVLPKNGITTSNVYTPATIIESTVINTSGVTSTAVNCWTSDFMAVIPGSTLTVGTAETSVGPNTGLLFYGPNFAPTGLGYSLPFSANQTFTVPANAAYARWCGNDANSAAQTLIQTTYTAGYQTRLLGPNETESFDGMAPVATIVDADSGATSRSTVLGAPCYNEGQATLTFFKDSTKQTTQTPQVGDMMCLRYRVPGAALGRVQDTNSVAIESAAFQDDGLRSTVVSGLTPLPRTDAECEEAASAYVQMNAYQHYEGSYTMPSGSWFTSEPKSGSLLYFKNLPPSYPVNLLAESVTEVVTTFDHMHGTESFNHEMTYGPINRMAQFLSILSSQTDVTVIQDTAEIPTFVDITSVGITNAPDITTPMLNSWDRNNLYLTTGVQPPVGGGFEIRYSDSGWGPDDGRNLVSRVYSGSTFSVPRNTRGKVCYVKAFDARNHMIWSEDLTQTAWIKINCTVTNVWDKFPNNGVGFVSRLVGTGPGASVGQLLYPTSSTAPATITYSVSVKGTAGQTVYLLMGNGLGANCGQTFTLRNGWQRLSMTYSFASMQSNGSLAAYIEPQGTLPIEVTACSVEVAPFETTYCKTNGTPYGAMSRYSSGIRAELPLIPPAPSATLLVTLPAPTVSSVPAGTGTPSPVIATTTTGTSATNPSGVVAVTVPSLTLSLILPPLAQDVWGFEVRGSDNATVLYHCDLSSSSYYPYVQFPLGTARTYVYYCYCYNLLGEYSVPQEVSYAIPTPTITNLQVVANNTTLQWNCSAGTGAVSFLVQILSGPLGSTLLSVTTTDYYMHITDNLFFGTSYYRVTPSDSLGAGVAESITYEYNPGALVFGANQVSVLTSAQTVINPRAPVFNPPPPVFGKYGGTYSTLVRNLYTSNTS